MKRQHEPTPKSTALPTWAQDALYADENRTAFTDAQARQLVQRLKLLRLAERDVDPTKISDGVIRESLPRLRAEWADVRDDSLTNGWRASQRENAETTVRKIIFRRLARDLLGLPKSAGNAEINVSLRALPLTKLIKNGTVA